MGKRKGNSNSSELSKQSRRELSRGRHLSQQIALAVGGNRGSEDESLSFGSEYDSSSSESDHDAEGMDQNLDQNGKNSHDDSNATESGTPSDSDSDSNDDSNARKSGTPSDSNSNNDASKSDGDSESDRIGEGLSHDSFMETDDNDESSTAQQLQDQQIGRRRQRLTLMRRLHNDGNHGLPPMLRCDGQHPMRRVVFALPAFVPATDRRGASLDLKQFTLPGATVVRAIDGSAQYLWFCSCSPENVVIKRTAEALHMMAGGCSDVKSATCDCVQFCQAILSNSGVDVGDMIEVAPMHHADDDGGSGRGKLHTLCSC